ncbi:MAG: HepT-like ribonuclease domain-containing protein [Candidatus Binatia bacterium]
MKKDSRVYLAHILECAQKIERYTRGGEKQFHNDTMLQDAVIRNFEIIGEAAKRVPETYRRRHSEIPWRLMTGFRDVLIHAYEGVDLKRVWQIPPLNTTSLL